MLKAIVAIFATVALSGCGLIATEEPDDLDTWMTMNNVWVQLSRPQQYDECRKYRLSGMTYIYSYTREFPQLDAKTLAHFYDEHC